MFPTSCLILALQLHRALGKSPLKSLSQLTVTAAHTNEISHSPLILYVFQLQRRHVFKIYTVTERAAASGPTKVPSSPVPHFQQCL